MIFVNFFLSILLLQGPAEWGWASEGPFLCRHFGLFCPKDEFTQREWELMVAIVNDNDDHVQELWATHRLNINLRVPASVERWSGSTYLCEAVLTSKDMVNLLLEFGADPDKSCANGQRPLHQGVIQGNREVLVSLLQAGASIDEANWEGRTPLGLAVKQGDVAIVRFLVAEGAYPYRYFIRFRDETRAFIFGDIPPMIGSDGCPAYETPYSLAKKLAPSNERFSEMISIFEETEEPSRCYGY